MIAFPAMKAGKKLAQNCKKYGLCGYVAITCARKSGLRAAVPVYPPGLPHGVYLRAGTSDELVLEDVIFRQAYHADLPFAPRVILDAGANIGLSSIDFANRYPSARILALEPEPDNYALLVRNTRHYPSITAVHAALWNHDGEISVSSPDLKNETSGNWAFVTHEHHQKGVRVRAVSMASLLEEFGVRTVDLVKMDIEGAEIEVFQAANWVHRIRALAIELHDRYRTGCAAAVDAAMRDFVRKESPDSQSYDVIWYTRRSDAAVRL